MDEKIFSQFCDINFLRQPSLANSFRKMEINELWKNFQTNMKIEKNTLYLATPFDSEFRLGENTIYFIFGNNLKTSGSYLYKSPIVDFFIDLANKFEGVLNYDGDSGELQRII
jgi:hypothetical protein